MCRHQIAGEEEDKTYNANEIQHGLTDVIPLLVFIVLVVAGFIVGIIAIGAGNPESLLYGTDYSGVTCGSANNHLPKCPYGDKNCDMTSRVMITYPRMNDDILQMLKDGADLTDPLALKFTGVCVSACPKAKTWTCTDAILREKNDGKLKYTDAFITTLDNCRSTNTNMVVASDWAAVGGECQTLMGQCWYNDIAGKETLFRCFPNYNETTYYGCDNDGDGIIDPGAEIRSKPYGTTAAEAKKCKTVIKTIKSQQPAQKNFLLEQLNAFAAIVGRYVGDIKNAMTVIMIVGVAGAVVMGFVWLFLLKKFARCMVWTIIFAVLILYVAVTLFLFVKAGMLTNPLDAEIEVDSTSQDLWKVGAYVMLVLTVIQFMMTAYFGKKINIAAAIIQEASKAIGDMPLLTALPLLPCAVIVGLFVWFLYGAAAIYTMTDMSSMTSAVASTGVNSTSITEIKDNALKDYIFVFHFFMFLWMNQFVQGMTLMIIAGAVSMWYFRPREVDDPDRKLTGNPILTSAKRAICLHAGSVAVGSFLVAVVQLMRAILAYLDRQSQNAQKKNCLIKLVFKCVACCLWCFEKCVKYICRQAYVIVMMDSKSFCSAAFSVFGLLAQNTAQMGLVAVISNYVIILGKVVIDLACLGICYIWLSQDATYTDETKVTYVSSAIFPVLVCVLLAHFVGGVFMTVYDTAIDTILIAFLKDKNNKMPFMGETLSNILDKPIRVDSDDDEEEDTSKAKASESRQSSNAMSSEEDDGVEMI